MKYRLCTLCGHEISELAWVGDSPGDHVVIVETPMTLTSEPTAAGDYLITAEQHVRFPTCAVVEALRSSA